jgi:tetratricopeptide (TPR) repeat protein
MMGAAMLSDQRGSSSPSFTSFGEMLRFLRRRSRLTQRDLGIAVGYSEGHINRFEKDKRLPDPAVVAALFVPALMLEDEPHLASRLVELTRVERPRQRTALENTTQPLPALETVPPAPAFKVARLHPLTRLTALLSAQKRLLISGLAGVGKTTMAADLAREQARSMPVFWFTIMEGVTAPVDSVVYQLALFLSEVGHPQAFALLQPASYQSPPSLDRCLALISAALNQQPALLCFDNVEAAAGDAAFLQVIRHLCATTACAMLLTSRETLPLSGFGEVTLTGLERGEALALIGSLSNQRLDDQQAVRLIDKTGGNPMLIRLALAQIVDDRVDLAPLIDSLDVQPQVALYLLETVQRQSSPAEWQMLSLLAVFVKPVNLYDETLIQLAHELGTPRAIAAAISNLQRRHLIDDASHAALNPLVRDYVYRALGVDSTHRRRLHRLAGDWYAETGVSGLSGAYHYAVAGLLDETVDAIAQNEKTIVARGEALAAVSLLDEVLTRREQLPNRPDDALRRLLTTRGYLLSATLRSAEAEADLNQALSLTSNPAVRADIVYRMRFVMLQRGHYVEALQLIQSARAALSPADLLLRAQLFAAESSTQELLGQIDEAERSAEQAVALANRAAHISLAPAEDIRSQAYYVLANVARRRRQVDNAIEYAQCALTSANRANLRIREIACQAFIGGMLYDTGDLDGSLRYRRGALSGAQAVEDQVGVGYYLTHLADIDYLLLHAEDAIQKLDQAERILEDTGEVRGLASALSLRTLVYLSLGNIGQARASILRVMDEMEGQATKRTWGAYLKRQATVYMVEENISGAQVVLGQSLAASLVHEDPMQHFEIHTALALAQVVDGKIAEAHRTLAEAPRIDGLSIWAELDRDLVEACAALADGQFVKAAEMAKQIGEQCRAYPYYRQCAQRLASATRERLDPNRLPRILWVGID